MITIGQTSASRLAQILFAFILFLAVTCITRVGAQSYVAGSPPNDAIAATYFPYHWTKQATVNYGAASSSEVGDIYVPDYTGKPTPANSTSRPAVIVVHGGGGTGGSRASTRELQASEMLASHGYVAFNIDYRIGAVYPQNIYDWRLAVRYLRAHAATYGIDPNHIGITGGSFGGFCSDFMSGITNGQRTIWADSNSRYNNVSLDTDGQGHPELYSGNVQCAFGMYGPCNQVTSGNAGGQYSSPTQTTLSNSSSIYYVHPGSAPLMLAHGIPDSTVSVSQSDQMNSILNAKGVPHFYARIPGGQHTFNIYDTSKGGTWPIGGRAGTIDLRKDSMDWFDKWLLVANNPPTITSQPNDTTGCVGSPASFSVVASGATPLYYQWSGPSGAISGATSATYTIASLIVANAGGYSVVVSNTIGLASSTTATLTVSSNTPPSITGQPTNQTVAAGSTVNIRVTSSGTSLQYQWTKDGVALPNATNATYSIVGAAGANSGVYQVSVYNNCFGAVSSNATLTVNAPPSMTGQPSDDTVCWGDSETFIATAVGVAPLSYQWYGPTVNHAIPGANTNMVTLTNLTAGDTGNYYLIVSNNYGAVTSSVAALTVSGNSQVTFVTQPTNTAVALGGTATFSFALSPSGGSSYTYLWLKNDYDPVINAVATNATLVISNVTAADDQAFYHCLVSNSCSTVASGNALLTVNFAPIISQQPDNLSTVSGASAGFTVGVDGTAPLSYQWSGPSGSIAGATNQTYTISNVSSNNVGSYSVRVTNLFGSVISSNVTLTVTAGNSYLQEPFNDSIGQLANDAPWTSHNISNTAGITVVGGGLTYAGLADLSPAGNVLQVTPISGQTNSYRPFDNTASNGIVYVSMLAKCSAPVGISGYGIFGLLPGSTTTVGGRTTDPLVLQVKTNTTGGVLFGVGSAGAAAAVYATGAVSLNTTTLVVLKYDLGTKAASLYLNPTVGNSEPGTPDATVTGTNSFGNLNYVYFRGVAGSGTWNYDTIRIASTWYGVLPFSAPVAAPPSITQQPTNQTVTAGSTATYSVQAAGTQPLAYQWRRGGGTIGGATNNTYSLSNVTTNDSGSAFDVVVTNAYGSVTSTPAATLTVTGLTPTAPQITQQPQSQTVLAGANPSFSVTAGGTQPLSYQWRRGGLGIGGATNSTYGLTAVTTNDSGSLFDVVLTNSAGSVTSAAASLTVNAQAAVATELLSLEAVKAFHYLQTSAAAPVLDSGTNGRSWVAEVQGILPAIITNATVSFTGTNLPNPYTIAPMDNTGLAESELFFGSKSALDAAVTNGNFHYVVQFASGNTYANDVPLGVADNYPNAPTLTAPAGDWTAGKLTLHAVPGGYQIAWGALTPAQANDQIGIGIIDTASGNDVTEFTIAGNITNYVIPGGLIDPNKDYDISLTFTHMSYLSTNGGGTILYGLFEALTSFTIHTDPAGVASGVPASNRATVRDGVNALVDIDEQTPGYVLTKYSTTGSAAKSYFQFDLTGTNADTSSPATLRLFRGTGGGMQRIQLWALNQTFSAPTNFNNINWVQAPANETNSNSMLTSGPATATLLADLQAYSSTSSSSNEIVIPAPWGQFVISNKLVLALTASVAIAGDTNSGAGYRVMVTNSLLLPTLRFSTSAATSVTPPHLAGTLSGGNVGFNFASTPGTPFTVLVTTNIVLPVASWTVLGPLTEAPAGTFTFTAGPATNGPRYYRVRSP